MLIPFSASSPSMELAITSSAYTAKALPTYGDQIRLVNEGPNLCYVALGGSNVAATVATSTAATTCTPVLPGSDIILTRSPDTEGYISAICDTGKTATLHVACGMGQ